MTNLLIIMAIGCVLALLSVGLFLLARWCELRSTNSAWSFSVLLMRLVANVLCLLALIAFFNVNVLALILVITVMIFDGVARRRLDRETLVWIMALTMARKMPLAGSVSAFAGECRGGYRWRVLRFAQRLQAGQSLSVALAQDQGVLGGLLTPDGAAAVCVGTACGDLPGALREAARVANLKRPFWQELGTRSIYLAQLLAITVGMTAWFMYFVIPALEKIFWDFDAKLPQVTQDLIRYSRMAPTVLMFTLLALIVLAPLAFLLIAFAQFDVPWLGGWLRRRHTPSLLRALAGVVERNQPLPLALDALAKSYPARSVRMRLKKVAEAMYGGAIGWQPWARCGIVNAADAAVLDAAERVGNLPWALRALAESQDRRRGYRLQVALQFVWPFAILAIGLVVGFIVVAGMMPLIELITKEAFTR
ncbi:MAG: type II secretion system F family protein [Planctomycetia bacterium]|nr:type II secretion system F family protein [Planctomycetia bacterium]